MIHHVTREILRSELDGCASFYALLGFEPDRSAGIEGRASVVWARRDADPLDAVDDADAAERARWAHVGVVIGRYDEIVGRIQAAGHASSRAVSTAARRADVRDPAGY